MSSEVLTRASELSTGPGWAEQVSATSLLDALPEHIAVLDRSGTITTVNKAWLRYAQANGGRPDGYLGVNYLDICFAGYDAKVLDRAALNAVEEVIRGKRTEFSAPYSCHSGEAESWFIFKIVSLVKPPGGALVAHRNVTEQHILDNTLTKAEEQFTRVFRKSVAPSLLISLDDLAVIDANNSFLQMVEYDRPMIVGKIMSELGLMPTVSRRVWLQLPNWVETNKYQVRMRSGRYRTVSVISETVDLKGQASIILMFDDVTTPAYTGEKLALAIKEVMQDTTWLSQAVMAKLVEDPAISPEESSNNVDLTSRERQVLQLIAIGLDNREISERLSIVDQTVRNHVSRIYSKLNVHSRAEAVVWARERGVLDA